MAEFEATPEQLERIALLLLLGILDARKQGRISETEESQILLSPTAIQSLADAGVSPETCAILDQALANEDLKHVDEALVAPAIERDRRQALDRIGSLDTYPVNSPRWFCAQADRRALAVLGPRARPTELRIELVCWLANGRALRREVSPSEYFDPVDADEVLQCDSTPIHIDTRDYFDLPHDEIVAVRVDVNDEAMARRRVLELRYWGVREKHQVSYLADYEADQILDWEYVVQVQERGRDAQHVLRISGPPDEWCAGVREHTRQLGDDGETLL